MLVQAERRKLPLFSSPAMWVLRLAFACLCVFGSEILLWTDPPTHEAIDWLLIFTAQIAIAAIMLDLVARFRVRDVYGLMTCFAIFAVLAGLLVNPATTLEEFPRHLITRVIGANGTFGLEMFGLLLVLIAGHITRYRWLLLGFAAWLGFYWGVWVRWTPELTDRISEPVSLETMTRYAVSILLVAALFFVLALALLRTRKQLSAQEFMLGQVEWAALAISLIAVLIGRSLQGHVELLPLVSGGVIIGLCWGVLWSQRSEKGAALLDSHLPPRPLSPLWIALAAALFFLVSRFSYGLELIDISGYGQYSLMEFVFALVGFSWLPLVAAVISIRTIDRFSRTNQW